MPYHRAPTLWFRLLLVMLVVTISYLAFTPQHFRVIERIWDKLNHVAAFIALAFATDFSFPSRKYDAAKIFSLLGYGIAIELIQRLLPYRDFEVLDVVADGVGLLVYGLSIPLLRSLPLLRERWDP